MSSNKDIKIPDLHKDIGSYHPINNMKDSIMNLLTKHGFEIVFEKVDKYDIEKPNIATPVL